MLNVSTGRWVYIRELEAEHFASEIFNWNYLRSESGEWRGEFSAKLDSHLPLVFRLFMFLVYDQEDANLFYQSQRGDKQCGIFALDLKIFFFEVKKSFCSSLKINSSCRDSETMQWMSFNKVLI